MSYYYYFSIVIIFFIIDFFIFHRLMLNASRKFFPLSILLFLFSIFFILYPFSAFIANIFKKAHITFFYSHNDMVTIFIVCFLIVLFSFANIFYVGVKRKK